MKRVIGLLFFYTTLLSPLAVAEVQDELLGVRYYGYYLSGDYISEIADHSNLTHVYANNNIEDRLRQAANLNMKVAVDLSQIFFKCNKNCTKLSLKTDYQSGWDLFKSQVAGLTNHIAAFYVVDEPARLGVSRSDIQVALNEIKANFPQIPTAAIFDTDNINGLVNMFDWVGFDCYDNGNNTCAPDATPPYVPGSQYEYLRGKLDHSRQRMILVPQAGYYYKDHIRHYHRGGVEAQLRQYHRIAFEDPLVIAVMPFIWQSVRNGKSDLYDSSGSGNFDGLKDVAGNSANPSRSIDINLYKNFGRDVVTRANIYYPPTLSPAIISILTTYILL
jgi:hypothetical protein